MDDALEESPEDAEQHRPVGTMFIMGLYVLALIGAWAWVYFVMAGRA